jgi:hypothetical protein
VDPPTERPKADPTAPRARTTLRDAHPVCFLRGRNYRVSATVGVSTVVTTPVLAILDTGAGPNLVREDVLPEDWERHRLKTEPDYHVVSAGGNPMPQRGVVTLCVQLGSLKTRSNFIVVKNLTAGCILGCQFIDRHVHSILPKERRVRLTEGGSVAILRADGTPDSDRRHAMRDQRSKPPSPKIRVATLSLIKARSEAFVPVVCQAPGLRFLQANLRGRAIGTYMANGVAEVIPGQAFLVRVVNTSLQDRKLPKGMILGLALPHPTGIVTLADLQVTSPESDSRRSLSEAEEYALRRDPPPVPDRPDVEGELWKEAVDLAHLTPMEREKVFGLLGKHRKMWDGRLGHAHATTHRIQLTPGAKPVHSQPYRAGSAAREAESAEIQRMLKAGVIEPASSEWASPVVLIPKPDGSMRFCVDYRRLNAVTVRDSYPLPRMDECIDSLGDAGVFSTLDCNSGYWQIPLHPSDVEKTTFTSHEGLYWFLRMPFGLRNAPATFQRFVDITLTGLTWKVCLVYLDDIIVFSKNNEEHMEHLDLVLHRLYRAGLSLNLKKCHFFKKEVSYLGHVIGQGTLSVSGKNTRALKTAKPPTTQTELRSFLGLCNVYRRFVPGFAKVAAPLNALLRKGESPQLGELTATQLQAFESLRDRLLSPPILALPKAEGQFILDTDASAEQIGCCLLQGQADGEKLPIGYWSRGLTGAERNYSTTEKECLAIVWAVLHLRSYLEGRHFVIRTDHHSLRWVLNLADAQGRLARWRLRLQEFDYEVLYLPGKAHHAADTMSRLKPSSVEDAPSEPVDTEIPCFAVDKYPHAASTELETIWGPVDDDGDPVAITLEELRDRQKGDQMCEALTLLWGALPGLDYDPNGILGNVLPTGEFQIVIPAPVPPGPLTVVYELSLSEGQTHPHGGDAMVLRGGETLATFATFAHCAQDGEAVDAVEENWPSQIQLEELRTEQEADDECRELFESSLRNAHPIIDMDRDGILVRKAPLDGSEQIVVPKALRARLLHLEHFPKAVGHPGVTKMFRSMRRRYFWRHLFQDVENTVKQCAQCARNNVQERQHANYMKLFPANEPLEYVAIDLLGPLPKTAHGNRYLLVISDRFSKLTRTVPLRTTTALVVAKAFCTHWVYAYGIPKFLLSDNGTQFTSKFFLEVCRELGIAKVFTTAYHPQTNGQVERFNRTILNALRAYVAKRQTDWDEYTPSLTFGYNSQVHASSGIAPFDFGSIETSGLT